MEGRQHTAVVLILTGSGIAEQSQEWDDWYCNTYWPKTLDNPAFSAGTLFQISDGFRLPSESTHLAVYESQSTISQDVVAGIEAELLAIEDGTHPPSMRPHVTSYTKTHVYGDMTGTKPTRGALLILADALHPGDEDNFNEWYDHHGPHAMQFTGNHVGIRYTADDLHPWQGKFLTLYETESDDPGKAHTDALEWWTSQPAEERGHVPLRLWTEEPFERRG